MSGCDISEFNDWPAGRDFYLIRVCHGMTEDRRWRDHYNATFAAHKPAGFYAVPESGDAHGQAQRFKDLCSSIPHTMGHWLDYAVGDLGNMSPNTLFVDAWRSVWDCGLYVNGAALADLPEYLRFERLWFSGSRPPARWLLWQTLALNQGCDVDVAADIGQGVDPSWTAFRWPGL